MRERGVLLFTESYEHRYPHCWRCKNPVIFRATPQWFISMDRAGGPVVERDEDGRDYSNFTENFSDESVSGGNSLRVAALAEIERVQWLPVWGRDRMRNMFKGRPDWCVSRQRVWGVPIPVFYCAKCTAAVADPKIINRVADVFEKESADAWYTREASELLPKGYQCGKCGSQEWTKETDILDVWFIAERLQSPCWRTEGTVLDGRCLHRGAIICGFSFVIMVGIEFTSGTVQDGDNTRLDVDAQARRCTSLRKPAPDEFIKESGRDSPTMLSVFDLVSRHALSRRFCNASPTGIESYVTPPALHLVIFMDSIPSAIAWRKQRCWK